LNLFFSIAVALFQENLKLFKKWINTIIQQSEYAKENNTRQLHIGAGMQNMIIFKKEQ